MSRQNHPHRESVDNCKFCGKKLCEECTISIASKNYCEECMDELESPGLTIKSTNNETQNTPTKQNMPIREKSYAKQAHTPIQKESETNILKETNHLRTNSKTDLNIIKPEILKQKIPSQNRNINNNPYISHDNRLYNEMGRDKNSLNENTGANRENKKLSLSEQLAQDEAKYGSITREDFVPNVTEKSTEKSDLAHSRINNNKNLSNMKNLRRVNSKPQNIDKEPKYTHSSFHREQLYKKEEKSFNNNTEKILALILIALIVSIVIYVIYYLIT